MTNRYQLPRDLSRRLSSIEKKLDSRDRTPIIPGIQVLPNGVPYFPRGFELGGGGMVRHIEPQEIPAPSNLTLSWGSSFDTIYLDLSWQAPAGYGANQVSSFIVQWVKEGESAPMQTTIDGVLDQVRVEPVEPNTIYTVSVFAQTNNGRTSVAAIESIQTGTDNTAPGPVTFPTNAVTSAVQALAIKWNANAERDVVNGAGQYRVRVSTNATLANPIQDVKVGAPSAYVGGLAAGVDYYIGVSAIDSSGNEGIIGKPDGGPWRTGQLVDTDIALALGGGNIVKDSGFEGGVPGSWVTTSALLAPTAGRGLFGQSALWFSGTGDLSAYQDLTLTPGKWTLSAWAKASGVARSSGSLAEGMVLSAAVVTGTATLGSPHIFGRGTFDWQRGSTTVTVAGGNAVVRLRLSRGFNGSATGNAWFDDVQAEAGSLTAYAPRADELLPGTVTSTVIADNAITTPKLAALSITAGKIAAGAIGADQIASRVITAGKIATNAITANELAANSVTATQLAASSVTANAIAANSITTTKLAANTITAEKLAVNMALTVGKVIQSQNYVAGATGWRIGGDGNAEFSNITIRGSAWAGGSINIANRLVASIGDPSVHLSANVEMGGNYSGTLYSGDLNWGFQVGNNGLGAVWTHMRAHLSGAHYVGFFDTARNAACFYVDSALNAIHAGPHGALIAEKRNQSGGYANVGLIVRNGGVLPNSDGSQAGISFHVGEFGVATTLKVVGPNGDAVEVRNSNDTAFSPIKASAFLVNSALSSKTDVRVLEDSALESILRLKPVRFKRPMSTVCSWCSGTGVVVTDDGPVVDGDDTPRHHVGDECPVCKGKSGVPRRSAQAKKYEDSDFIGLIAGEAASEVPELASWTKTETGIEADAIDYAAVVALLVKATQQIESRLSAVEKTKTK
ncbi:fibronectin type III domain-containing protein [Kocuria rosea]|uniref:fibronectin type III domain-containing protein n=1 Tax=Kocuria rosea TaxID=1275 RepID=UPI0011A35430|nr:fibronectin type III domain-containing protein [Kocuria rosea]